MGERRVGEQVRARRGERGFCAGAICSACDDVKDSSLSLLLDGRGGSAIGGGIDVYIGWYCVHGYGPIGAGGPIIIA